MKRIALFVSLLFLAGVSAYGEQTVPHGPESARVMQDAGDGTNQRGGPRFGPPPEAYSACKGKSEGSIAQFTGPQGETVTGTCRVADGRLVLRPDRRTVDRPESR